MFEVPLLCLAFNVYYEARGEPVSGQHAVALVTINRAKNKGKTVCSVVFEQKQFSWTIKLAHNGKIKSNHLPDFSSNAWSRSLLSAYQAMQMNDFTCGATHFHATRVRPFWKKSFKYVGKYGKHKFYVGDYGDARYTCTRLAQN